MRSFIRTHPNVPPAAQVPMPKMIREQEIQMLKDQMKILQDQLDQIKKRLKELEK